MADSVFRVKPKRVKVDESNVSVSLLVYIYIHIQNTNPHLLGRERAATMSLGPATARAVNKCLSLLTQMK